MTKLEAFTLATDRYAKFAKRDRDAMYGRGDPVDPAEYGIRNGWIHIDGFCFCITAHILKADHHFAQI